MHVTKGTNQAPHLLCEPLPGVAPRGQLVRFFEPTSLQHVPPANQPFVQHARSLGFHFFGVSYPDSPAISSGEPSTSTATRTATTRSG